MEGRMTAHGWTHINARTTSETPNDTQYTHIKVHKHFDVCVFMWMSVDASVCVSVGAFVCACVFVCVRVHLYVHACVCVV